MSNSITTNNKSSKDFEDSTIYSLAYLVEVEMDELRN